MILLYFCMQFVCSLWSTGYPTTPIIARVVTVHFDSCTHFIKYTLQTSSHHLHDILSSITATSITRRQHQHIYARTSIYKNSLTLYLARFLIYPSVPLVHLYSFLDCDVVSLDLCCHYLAISFPLCMFCFHCTRDC